MFFFAEWIYLIYMDAHFCHMSLFHFFLSQCLDFKIQFFFLSHTIQFKPAILQKKIAFP